MWLWVKTNGTLWGFRCTAHFSLFYWVGDVHWGYGILTHGHVSDSAARGTAKKKGKTRDVNAHIPKKEYEQCYFETWTCVGVA